MTGVHRGIRWRNDEWELRCDDCHAKPAHKSTCYWPLGDEFWDKSRMTRCRSCHRAREKARMTEDERERRRQYVREWRERNPEYSRDYMQLRRRLFPDDKRARQKTYYWLNRERILEQQKEYKARQRAERAA